MMLTSCEGKNQGCVSGCFFSLGGEIMTFPSPAVFWGVSSEGVVWERLQ